MALTDLQIRGGGAGYPDPEIRLGLGGEGLQNVFFRPFGSHFGLKIRGRPDPLYPSPGSASESDVTIGPLKRLCHKDIAALG